MSSVTRLLPYLWPYRYRVAVSVIFAVLVALFWGVNLSVAFPVVKVLLQGETLAEYVEREIAEAELEISKRTYRLKMAETDLATLDAVGAEADPEKRVQVLRNLSNQQTHLSEATQKRLVMSRLQTYVLPWLPRDRFDTLAAILGVLLVATMLKGICMFVQECLVGSVVELTIIGIRKDCLRKALRLDYQTLTKGGTAKLMSHFTYDMEVMGQGLNLIGGKVVREPLKAICCLAGAFWVSWQLTMLSMLFIPLVGLVFYRIGRKLKQASHRMMESMSRLYKTLEETFEGLKVVIAFNGAPHHRRRFHIENKKYYEKAMKIVRLDSITSPTTEFLGLIAAFVALLPAAYLVLRGTTDIWGFRLVNRPMDVAELSVLYVMLAGVLDPIRKLSTTYAKLKRAHAAGDRVFGLLDQEPTVRQPVEPKPFPRHSRSIELRNLHFTYPTNDVDVVRPPALNDVSLTVHAGEVIVIVGENGSGKSTLLNLLPRFYDPEQGQILIDGVDICDVRLKELRNQISIVTQETVLFDESIYDNIRYGRPSASREEIEQAARDAHVTSFLEPMPEGFQTIVGEKGCKLSGGQRQRIALARAILRDPSIVILDEATSAIDAQSETLIYQALRNFVKGRTTFIITHTVSPAILDFVTRVAVMDQGRLIAAGPHLAVLQTCPIYQKLFHARQHFPATGGSSSMPLPAAAHAAPRTESVNGVAKGTSAETSVSDPEGDSQSPEPLIIPLRKSPLKDNSRPSTGLTG